MRYIIFLLLFLSQALFAQREIVTFGPNSGEMPTVVFGGDKREGYIKIYIGKDAKAGDLFTVNVNNGTKIDSFAVRVRHDTNPRIFIICDVDRAAKVLRVRSSQPIHEGAAIRFYWKVFSKRAKA